MALAARINYWSLTRSVTRQRAGSSSGKIELSEPPDLAGAGLLCGKFVDSRAGETYALRELTAKHKVATPVNWKHGDDVIILPAVSDEEAR